MIKRFEKWFFNLHETIIILIYGVVTLTTLFYINYYFNNRPNIKNNYAEYIIVVVDPLCKCDITYKTKEYNFLGDYIIFNEQKIKKSYLKTINVKYS